MKLFYFSIFFVFTSSAHAQLIQTSKYLKSHAKLLDITGRIVQTALISSNNTRIDISNLHRGSYFVKLFGGQLLKFIK